MVQDANMFQESPFNECEKWTQVCCIIYSLSDTTVLHISPCYGLVYSSTLVNYKVRFMLDEKRQDDDDY